MKSPRKILVFRQSSLGDIILTLPVVKELRENYPDAAIDYLTKAPYYSLVRYHPALRNVIVFKDNEEFKNTLKLIRAEKYDLIIDLQRNFRSIALSVFNPFAKMVRYKKRRLAREMIIRKPSTSLSVDHTVNAYFHTLRKLGIKSKPSPPVIFLSDNDREFAEDFISKSFENTPTEIVALCPGARHPEKMWPWENYRSVAETLLQNDSTGIIVISASSDSIPENLNIASPRLVEVKDFEILRVAALLAHCNCALTNDSGLMHLANAVGTKVAAIFGPTSPRLGFSPTLPGSTIISNNVFCSPCSLHGEKPCRQPQKICFENIESQRVADIIKNMF